MPVKILELLAKQFPWLRTMPMVQLASWPDLTGNAYKTYWFQASPIHRDRGKSTLTCSLIHAEKRAGIIAVNPSSPISGGAVLDDRIRMMDHALDWIFEILRPHFAKQLQTQPEQQQTDPRVRTK